jgi:hypothetical protein
MGDGHINDLLVKVLPGTQPLTSAERVMTKLHFPDDPFDLHPDPLLPLL